MRASATGTWSLPSFARRGARRKLARVAGSAAVSVAFAACRALAPVAMVADAVLRPRIVARAWRRFARAGVDAGRALRDTWFARLARESLHLLMRAGLRRAVLDRVRVVGDQQLLERGTVLAVCHSPWGRVLGGWLARDRRVAVVAAGRWEERAPGACIAADRRAARSVLREVRGGRCVAVTIDHFGAVGVPATLLGREARVASGAARLAACAHVPLVPARVRYAAGHIEVVLEREIVPTADTAARATVDALRALRLDREPAGWADALRFAGRADGAR